MTAPAETIIDHTPAVVHHVGLVAGVAWTLTWSFGPADAPEDLTGQAATLYLDGHPYPVAVAGDSVTLSLSAAESYALPARVMEYVLELGGQVAVTGRVSVARRVTP